MPRTRYASDARRRGIPEPPSEAQQRLTDMMGDNPEAYDEWVKTQVAPTHEMNPDHFQSFLDERTRKAGGTVPEPRERIVTDVAMPDGTIRDFTEQGKIEVPRKERPHVTFDLPKQEVSPPVPPMPMPVPPKHPEYPKQPPLQFTPASRSAVIPQQNVLDRLLSIGTPNPRDTRYKEGELEKAIAQQRRDFTRVLPGEVDETIDPNTGMYVNVPDVAKAKRNPEEYMRRMISKRKEVQESRNEIAREISRIRKEAESGKHHETGLPLPPDLLEERKYHFKKLKDLLPYVTEKDGQIVALPYGMISPPKGHIAVPKESKPIGIESPTFEKVFGKVTAQPSLPDLSDATYKHQDSGQDIRYGDVVEDMRKTKREMNKMLYGPGKFRKQSDIESDEQFRYYTIMQENKGKFESKEERQRWNELRSQYERDRKHLQVLRAREGILDFDDNIRRNYGSVIERKITALNNGNKKEHDRLKAEQKLYERLYPELRTRFTGQTPIPDDILKLLVEAMGGGTEKYTDSDGQEKTRVKKSADYSKVQALIHAYPQLEDYLRIYSTPLNAFPRNRGVYPLFREAFGKGSPSLHTKAGDIVFRSKTPRVYGPSLFEGIRKYENSVLKNLGRDFEEPAAEEPIPIPGNPLDWEKGEGQSTMGSVSDKIDKVFNDYYATPEVLGANLRKTIDKFRGRELTHGEQMERNEAIAEYIRGIDQYNSVVENRAATVDPRFKTSTDRSHKRHDMPQDLIDVVRREDSSGMQEYNTTKEQLSALNGQLRTLTNEHDRILSLGKVNGMTTPLSDRNQQALSEVAQQIDFKRQEIEMKEAAIRQIGTEIQERMHNRFSDLSPVDLEEMLPHKFREPFKKDLHEMMSNGIPMSSVLSMYDIPGLGEEPHITQSEFVMIKNARKEMLRKHHLGDIQEEMIPTQDELDRYRDLVNGNPVVPGQELSEESLNKITTFLPRVNEYQDAISTPSTGETHMLATMSQEDRDTLPEFERTLELQKKPADQLTEEDEREMEEYERDMAMHIARNRTNSSVIDAMDRLAKDDRSFDEVTEDELNSLPEWARGQIQFLRKMGDADQQTYSESLEPDKPDVPLEIGSGMSDKDIPNPQDTLATEEDRLRREESQETQQAVDFLTMPTVLRKIDTATKELQSMSNTPYALKRFKKPEERIEYTSQHMPERWYENTPTWVNPVFKEIFEGRNKETSLGEFAQEITESFFNKNMRRRIATVFPGWDEKKIEYRGATYIVLPRSLGLGPLRITAGREDPDIVMTREYVDIIRNMQSLANDYIRIRPPSGREDEFSRKILYDIRAVYDKLPAECRGWRKSNSSADAEEYMSLAEENSRTNRRSL
jgi:hypothetical protein